MCAGWRRQPEPPDNGVPDDERSSCHHTPPAYRPAPAMGVPGRCPPYTWRCRNSRLFHRSLGSDPTPRIGRLYVARDPAEAGLHAQDRQRERAETGGENQGRERRQLHRLGGDNASMMDYRTKSRQSSSPCLPHPLSPGGRGLGRGGAQSRSISIAEDRRHIRPDSFREWHREFRQDDPEDGFSSSYPPFKPGQALRKQVSLLWIPAFAGMTGGSGNDGGRAGVTGGERE